jgi:hypothetical protein
MGVVTLSFSKIDGLAEMRKRSSECPAPDCSAARPAQHVQDPEALVQAGATGQWTTDAHRCAYCGTVWSYRPDGGKTIRGFIAPDGDWVSRR